MTDSGNHSGDGLRRTCQRACEAQCCRYFTVVLPAPRHRADFDEISWFLAHEDISVYVEGRRWHLEVRNRCKYLMDDSLCAIYENRPEVCREHNMEACEYPRQPRHSLQFDTKEEFDAWWARKRERERRRRKRKSRQSVRSSAARGASRRR